MKSTNFPKKHIFSERPKSVKSSHRDISPNAKMNSSRDMHSPSTRKSFNSNCNTPQKNHSSINLNMSELIFNVNDDHKTLINKNRKLSNLLIQASNKISEIVYKF